MILMPLDRGRFVVVQPCSTFSDCCQLATLQNAEFQNGKIWGFSPPEGDRINRSRRSLARKRRPWVCSSTPNLALIGLSVKGWVGTSAPEMSKFAQNCGFLSLGGNTINGFGVVWHVRLSVDGASTV